MSALLVIPARLASTRLREKPLQLLGGSPLIVRVLERVRDAVRDATVVVATDSERVAGVVRDAGGVAVLTSDAHPSGTDRVAEVAEMPAYRRHDLIVSVQGDEPFVTGSAVAAARHPVESGAYRLGTVACADDPVILESPSVVKVVRDAAGRALYFSRAPIPFLRDASDRNDRDALVLRHLGIYVYRRDALLEWVAMPPAPLERVERLEQLRPLAAGMPIGVGVVDEPAPGGIDTPADLDRANAAWSSSPKTTSPPEPAASR